MKIRVSWLDDDNEEFPTWEIEVPNIKIRDHKYYDLMKNGLPGSPNGIDLREYFKIVADISIGGELCAGHCPFGH